jgi:anti-anti-sigma factor
MDIEILENSGEVLHLALVGRVVRDNSQPLTECLKQILGPRGYSLTVVIDMRRATFIDSAGLSFLILSHKRFLQEGGKLIFHSLSPAIRTLFETMGLHQVFLLAENREEALRLAEGKTSALPNSSAPRPTPSVD